MSCLACYSDYTTILCRKIVYENVPVGVSSVAEEIPLISRESDSDSMVEEVLEFHDRNRFLKISCIIGYIIHATWIACWIRDTPNIIMMIISCLSGIFAVIGLHYNSNNILINISLCSLATTFGMEVFNFICYTSLDLHYDIFNVTLLIICVTSILWLPVTIITIRTQYKYTWRIISSLLIIGIILELINIIAMPNIFLSVDNNPKLHFTPVKCFTPRFDGSFPLMKLATEKWHVDFCEDNQIENHQLMYVYLSDYGQIYGHVLQPTSELRIKIRCGGIWYQIPPIKIGGCANTTNSFDFVQSRTNKIK